MTQDPRRLTLDETLDVSYCIPSWLRDEQVRYAVARTVGRIEECANAQRPEPAAIACFGPSLTDTWEKLREFKYVFSCSGSHKFLLERGIVPTWHVEVDPRKHKVELLGTPHPDVIYLPASACHPKYFDWLEQHNANVKMWHVFNTEEEAVRLLPPNEWAITGGCSVGLRCLTLARFFGFRDLHIFGMDGNEGPTGKHAAAHPNQPKKHSVLTHNGIEYRTTPGFLEAARQTLHELDMLSDVQTTFYGDGLVQALVKEHVRKPKTDNSIIAMAKPELISAQYRELNMKLHRENLAYGVGGGKHAPIVLRLAETLKTQSILDYGCGKGYLAKAIPFPIWEYDPAIPGKDISPRPADLVICTDVLEHIEPDRILYVLADLRRCVQKIGYFLIHTGPSSKSLDDGRNAHLLQRDARWWKQKLKKFFGIGQVFEHGPLLHIVVKALAQKPKIQGYTKTTSATQAAA